jgi:hypothetical protein
MGAIPWTRTMRSTPLPLPVCLLLGFLAAAGCTSHEGAEPQLEAPKAAKIELRAAIASVQLAQDCPDPPPAAAPEQAPAAAARAAPGSAIGGGGPGWSPPCTQSNMQLTLSHDGKEALPLEIKAIRLTAAGNGGVLATVPFRAPSKWTEGGRYDAWDQQLAPSTEVKASYKLGQPDWSLVAKAIGSDDTYGKRYVLEVDLTFAGRSITVRSPEFEREREHVIVT